jgi:aminopeptidase N
MTEVAHLQHFFKPTRYDLQLIPNKSKMTFRGAVKIVGQISPKQKWLRLHSKDLAIETVKINGLNAPFRVVKKLDELQIALPKLINNNALVAHIKFCGQITKQTHGMYPCTCTNGEVFIASHLESHHAREIFPCIDEPSAKAVFCLSLTVPQGEVALSNTLPVSKTAGQKSYIVHFNDTPLMSTYLLAFVIGKFRCHQTKTTNGVLVRAWALPGQLAQVDFCLDVATKSLDFFNDYLQYPYPLPKLDLVALPDFGATTAAMENWGLITFRESCMLVDEQNTSLDAKQAVAVVTAHEVIHQWLGNLVTMRWWNDLWLIEGFASWLEYLVIDKLFPAWHMWTQFLASEQLSAFRSDALKNTHSIEVKISHPDEIRTIFDNISYAKGASVVHMLHDYLGDKAFRTGLVAYLKKYAYANTTTDDLWEILEITSGLPVKSFMSAWTSQPGFPLVEVKKAKGLLDIRQSRFSNGQSKNVSQPLWPIPLLAPTLPVKTFDTPKVTIKAPHNLDEFKLNVGQSGFYITKYWPKQYDRLGELIAKGRLGESDRLSLLAEMLALTKTGRLPLRRLVKLLPSFTQETSEPVWNSIALVLSDIRRVMGPDVREAIKPLVNDLTAEQVNRLGWNEKSHETYFDKLLRPLVLALADSADNQAVVGEAYARFWQADIVEDLDKDLKCTILISVSRRGGQAEFDKMLKMHNATPSAEDKLTLVSALTNFRQPNEYQRALKLIRSNEVRLQDAIYWLVFSLANPAARDSAWRWTKQHWQWLKTNLGDDTVYSRLPVIVANNYSDKAFLKDYRAFFTKVTEPSLKRAIKQGAETIQLQTKWRQRDHDSLLNWLIKR